MIKQKSRTTKIKNNYYKLMLIGLFLIVALPFLNFCTLSETLDLRSCHVYKKIKILFNMKTLLSKHDIKSNFYDQ